MAVFAYTRVSTDRQASEGESLDVQERTIAGYAMMHGLAVDRVFREKGVSGSKPLDERPEGAALLEAAGPGDIIITAKLDRMFRSALDALRVLGEMKKRGVSLHMIDLGGDVTSNGVSKLVFTILSAVAEVERDRIRERVADTKADQKQRGRFLGGTVPFGWAIGPDKELKPVADAQEAIGRMRAMRAAGESFRSIAGQMKAEGFALTHEAVRKVLARQ
jgi:DNA invertase Pin-like site-specific DNA recombinase